MKKFFSTILALMIMVTCILGQGDTANAAKRTLTKAQQRRADIIAQICIDNWDKYGVLPSTCLAQAFVESTMGDHCSGYNLWGIKAGKVKYSDLEKGTIAYLEVINNGYYKNAPFCKGYKTQIKRILAGGYCVPADGYYGDAVWAIEAYDFTSYDEKLFKELKKKKAEKARKKAQREAKKKALEKAKKEKQAKIREKKLKNFEPLIPSSVVTASFSAITIDIDVSNQKMSEAQMDDFP